MITTISCPQSPSLFEGSLKECPEQRSKFVAGIWNDVAEVWDTHNPLHFIASGPWLNPVHYNMRTMWRSSPRNFSNLLWATFNGCKGFNEESTDMGGVDMASEESEQELKRLFRKIGKPGFLYLSLSFTLSPSPSLLPCFKGFGELVTFHASCVCVHCLFQGSL